MIFSSPMQTSIFLILVTSLIVLIVHKYVVRFDSVMRLLKTYGLPFAFSELDEHVMRTPHMMKKNKKERRDEKKNEEEDVPKLELPTKMKVSVKKDVSEENAGFGDSSKEDESFQMGESNDTSFQMGESNDTSFQMGESNDASFQMGESNDMSFQMDESKDKNAFQFNALSLNEVKEDIIFPPFPRNKEPLESKKQINLEHVGSEDDVFEKPTFKFQRILGDSYLDIDKKREEKEEEEEVITFVSKTQPQVSQDPSTADMYLLKELERYKVRKAQERRKARNEAILKRHLDPLEQKTSSSSVFESSSHDEDMRLPKLNLHEIQDHQTQREWSCRLCNTRNVIGQDKCRACGSSCETRKESCPACHFVSTKDSNTCCELCGFVFSSKIQPPVVEEDSILMSRSVSLKGFVETFGMEEEEEKKKMKRSDESTTNRIENKENKEKGEIPFHSIMFDVQMERNDTPTKYDKTRRRRQLIGSGPCLTPSGDSIFKSSVDNVVLSSSLKEKEVLMTTPTEKKNGNKREVKDILAEMSMLWEQFPE